MFFQITCWVVVCCACAFALQAARAVKLKEITKYKTIWCSPVQILQSTKQFGVRCLHKQNPELLRRGICKVQTNCGVLGRACEVQSRLPFALGFCKVENKMLLAFEICKVRNTCLRHAFGFDEVQNQLPLQVDVAQSKNRCREF